MPQEQLLINPMTHELMSVIEEDLVPADRLQRLVAQSMTTLEAILANPEISASERATIALKILEMAGISSQASLTRSESVRENGNASHFVAREPIPTQTNGSTSLPAQPQSALLPAKYIQIDNFLSPEEHQQLLEITFQNTAQFVTSSTSTQDDDYRKSAVLYATLFPEFYELVRKKIFKTVPSVLQQLQHPSFLVTELEMQMTAHNDGCYYKRHNDSGSPDTHTRELTYVYYFYKEPKSFSGGELRVYDTDLKASLDNNCGDFKTVEPRNNSIVFFNSASMHEVLPVHCPSRAFEDSRFTLNGWLRRNPK